MKPSLESSFMLQMHYFMKVTNSNIRIFQKKEIFFKAEYCLIKFRSNSLSGYTSIVSCN